jgi:HAD superfamily hydrolase (TIGR01509 family)
MAKAPRRGRGRKPAGRRAVKGRTNVATLSAIILDFDGLIVDTETPIFEAWSAAFARRGQELRLEEWQHALGTYRGFDPCGRLSELVGEKLDRDALEREVREPYLAACEAQPLLPGVVDLLEEARSLGLGTAVASSATRGWVTGWLGKHGIGGLFDSVCGREDVPRVKPAPDLFLLAALRLGVAPPDCLVFEDSPNGIRAARAAGMRCVAVPNPVTRPLDLGGPDLVLGRAAEIPLAEVARRVGLALAQAEA